MKRVVVPLAFLRLVALVVLRLPLAGPSAQAGEPLVPQKQAPAQKHQAGPKGQPGKAGDAALAVTGPVPFATKDGKSKGWKVVLPGKRALATPAVVGGKVFIGGGFGSHAFY